MITKRRPWSSDATYLLKLLLLEGTSYENIAMMLSRSVKAVINKASNLKEEKRSSPRHSSRDRRRIKLLIETGLSDTKIAAKTGMETKSVKYMRRKILNIKFAHGKTNQTSNERSNVYRKHFAQHKNIHSLAQVRNEVWKSWCYHKGWPDAFHKTEVEILEFLMSEEHGTAAEISRTLFLGESYTARKLSELIRRGLLQSSKGTYRLAPEIGRRKPGPYRPD